jgi:hypothetical protein
MTVSDLLAGISQRRAQTEEESEDDSNTPMSIEELLAAVAGGSNTGRNPRTGKFVPRRQAQKVKPVAGSVADKDRPPRKCANCGKTHPERICPHPAIPREERACWTCGKKNHSSRDCPDKVARGQAGSPLKAIEDLIKGMPAFSVVDEDDGWRQASQMQRRPQPRRITVGDFVPTSTSNKFGDLPDSADSRRCKPPGISTKRVATPPRPKLTTMRPTPTLDDMTLDELDKIIQEEEARFTSIMNAEEDRKSVV